MDQQILCLGIIQYSIVYFSVIAFHLVYSSSGSENDYEEPSHLSPLEKSYTVHTGTRKIYFWSRVTGQIKYHSNYTEIVKSLWEGVPILMLKGRKQSYGQNRLLIIYDDKWFEPSYVTSRLLCTSVGAIPLYGKTCVRRTLRGEVLAHPCSRCGVTLCWRYIGEFGICRYVGRRF